MTSSPAVSDRPAPPAIGPAAARFGALRRHRRWLPALVVIALLAEMAIAMVTTAVRQTPTIDEPVYVGAAAIYLREHSLRDNPEHPPLGKLIIGAGVAVARPRLDTGYTGSQGAIGRHLLYESGNDAGRLLALARLPMILLTLLFGLVVFAFARDVAGRAAALVALALYAFSPDLIAHGSLATLDVAAAGFLLTSAWLLWRARRRPLRYLPLAGLALGAALATKMSALAAVPVLLGLAIWSVRAALLDRGPDRDRDPRAAGTDDRAAATGHGGRPEMPGRSNRPAVTGHADPSTVTGHGGRPQVTGRGGWPAVVGRGALAAAGVTVVAVAVVWASYLAVDPRLRWTTPGDLPPVHGLRALLTDWLPFPRPYRDGMRVQFGFEDATWSGFLFGRLYRGSLWYYLPAALLVKTPLGMLALWLAGAAAIVALPRTRRAAPYVLLPTAVLLAAAMTGSRDLGVRYAIFVPMFLAVAAACVIAVRWRRGPTGAASGRAGVAAVVGVALLFVAVSSLRTFPYYLPYSNEAFGGPPATYRHLHDSNVDWGQDLGRLAERLRQRYPGEKVWLVYKGSGVPSYYGIDAADPREVPPSEVRGLLVVSDTSIDKANARLRALIRSSTRIDTVGHSITIFRRT